MTGPIDVVGELSLARTALDDPGYFPAETFGALSGTHTPEEYAIDRIDTASSILRDDHQPDELLAAMTFYGRALAGIAEELHARGLAPVARLIEDGLDNLDAAIEAATEELGG